jgi:hypothetical protein
MNFPPYGNRSDCASKSPAEVSLTRIAACWAGLTHERNQPRRTWLPCAEGWVCTCPRPQLARGVPLDFDTDGKWILVDMPPREGSSASPAACLPAGQDPAPPLRAPAACWCVSAFVAFGGRSRNRLGRVRRGAPGGAHTGTVCGPPRAAPQDRSLGAASRALALSRALGPRASTHPQSLRRCRRPAARWESGRPARQTSSGSAIPPCRKDRSSRFAWRILARRRSYSPRSALSRVPARGERPQAFRNASAV